MISIPTVACMMGDRLLLTQVTDPEHRVEWRDALGLRGVAVYERVHARVAEIAVGLRDPRDIVLATDLITSLAARAADDGVDTLRSVVRDDHRAFAKALPWPSHGALWQMPAGTRSVACPERDAGRAPLWTAARTSRLVA